MVLHKSKNWGEEYLLTNRAKYRVWTGPGSWGPDRRGILVGALLRANSNCSRQPWLWARRVIVLLIVLLEAERFGGYTRKVLGSVLEYLMFKHGHNEPIWEIMVRTVGREPLWIVYVKFNQMWQFVLEVAAVARSAP